MSDEQTCGKGLAENSVVPAGLGSVAAAMAEVLENHRKALDPGDANGKAEDEAYAELANALREASTRLKATAERMAGYRDLPMAGHDVTALMSASSVESFSRLVDAERDLLQLLEANLARYEPMLHAMRTAH